MRELLKLCESMNFTRTSRELHLSQSALSKHVPQIEDELGAPEAETAGVLLHSNLYFAATSCIFSNARNICWLFRRRPWASRTIGSTSWKSWLRYQREPSSSNASEDAVSLTCSGARTTTSEGKRPLPLKPTRLSRRRSRPRIRTTKGQVVSADYLIGPVSEQGPKYVFQP